ncbi:tryptophan 2,3-dioxygenase family protein [Solicola gregarius]|uniref:Tryptophan 2,3-dioxygenase family protein n=1 Tax=Solicola gregarius TaxID=2908642 RepID=A0AA46YIW2_9ACTN|nr:tryptophan 2,3-dioxygenase family protein [Solicola gregarius]UYM03645.1 tryptophan 2,3-dioxygenase family protein [Solicola gregarius]
MSDDLTYADYINVDELLGLQRPRTPDVVTLTRTCEHFFIVTHQTSELWLNQVLLDLDEATTAVEQVRYLDAEECAQRCATVLEVMASNLDVLATMPPGRFASFRGELGHASGAQSRQFRQFDRRIGVGGRSPLLEALLAACDREQVTLPGLLYPGHREHPDLAKIVLAMLDLSRNAWRWKVMHLELVNRMIGVHTDGTGGSAGSDYLAGRLRMPFEPLWSAVSKMHEYVATPGLGDDSTGSDSTARSAADGCPHLATGTA